MAGSGSGYIMGDPWSKRLYAFDSNSLLTQIADGHGNTQTLSYSGDLLTNVSDGLGRFLNFEYNADGQLTNVSDGTRSIGFVQTGTLLSAATDALGNTTTYSYDTNNGISGLLTAITLPVGNQPFVQTFDTNGRVVTQVVAGELPRSSLLLLIHLEIKRARPTAARGC
jgi:YD repeat-containing protein